MDYLNAFWVGGLICALVQILLDKTKLMPGRVMVLLVCTGTFWVHLGFISPYWIMPGPEPKSPPSWIWKHIMDRNERSY